MSIDTISDVLSRIGGIEQQLQALRSGPLLATTLATSQSPSSDVGSTSSSSFANELAAASQDSSSGLATDPTSAAQASFSSLGNSAIGASSLGSAGFSGGVASEVLPSTGNPAGISLSSAARSQLTSGQQQFAATLSADTGLNPNVVSAWLLAEESGGAAQSRQAAGNNDWLNIGYTDSGTYGSSDAVWADPNTAANATAAWMKGQAAIPGYGTASSGIQSVLSTVGGTPETQIQAIQNSGWSSSGYPSLVSLYQQVSGF